MNIKQKEKNAIKEIQQLIFGDIEIQGQQAMIVAFIDFARGMETFSRYQFIANRIEDDELKGEEAMFHVAEAFWLEAQHYMGIINTVIITNANATNEEAVSDFKTFCDQRLAA